MDNYECLLQWLLGVSEQWFRMNGNIGISSGDHINLRNELIMISQEIDKTYPTISKELFRLKDAVLWQTGFINPVILGELIALIS